jgi:hypothetical protein
MTEAVLGIPKPKPRYAKSGPDGGSKWPSASEAVITWRITGDRASKHRQNCELRVPLIKAFFAKRAPDDFSTLWEPLYQILLPRLRVAGRGRDKVER